MSEHFGAGHNSGKQPFRDRFVDFLKDAIKAFAEDTPGFRHFKQSKWAYAFNPLPDGHPEKPVYATMASLIAPNLAQLRIGITEGGQIILEFEHGTAVAQKITDDIDDPNEFADIRSGMNKLIEFFEERADLPRGALSNRIEYDPEMDRLAEMRHAGAEQVERNKSVEVLRLEMSRTGIVYKPRPVVRGSAP